MEAGTALLQGLLDHSPYLVMLVDEMAGIRWANAASVRIFGYEPDEIVGTNILDHLDTEWNSMALESIGAAMAAEGLRLPMLFRAIRKDGRKVICEVWANSQVADPVLQGLVVYVRPWDERVLLDRAFESLAAGDPIDATLRLLVTVMGQETLEAEAAVLHGWDGHGFREVVACDELPDVLAGRGETDNDAPWRVAALDDRPHVVATADLPEPLRAAAVEHGVDTCWAWPIPGPTGREPDGCLVVWRRADEVQPDHSRIRLLDFLVRVAGLTFERIRTRERLEHAASHDALTTLANRSHFYAALDDAAERRRATEGFVGVLYLDLDGFKPINDEHGHGAGDAVLIAVADRLGRAVREGDLVARLGGDEFAVLCPDVGSLDELERLAARLVTTVRVPVDYRGEKVTVGVSIGLSLSVPGEASGDELVEAADSALYAAKADGKGCWRVVAPVRR